MNIRLANSANASAVAKIHQTEIKNGFLSSLGLPFLEIFYQAVIVSPVSFCLIAEEAGLVTGFIAGVESMPRFYRYFMVKHFFTVFAGLFPKLFRIGVLKKIMETLWYPKKTDNLPAAELLAIAVTKNFQGQGLGTQLLQTFLLELKKRGIAEVKVLVGKNLPAVAFYKKHEFKERGEIFVHASDPSLILTYIL